WSKDIDIPAAATLDVKVPLTALPERRKWPSPFASVTFAVGAGAVVVGIVTVALSRDAPLHSTVTRREAVDSPGPRYLENLAGWRLMGIGLGLGITAAGIAIAYRHDIFGEAKPKTRASLLPRLDGGGVGVSW